MAYDLADFKGKAVEMREYLDSPQCKNPLPYRAALRLAKSYVDLIEKRVLVRCDHE